MAPMVTNPAKLASSLNPNSGLAVEQILGPHPKTAGQGVDVLQADVALPPLQAGDVRPVEVGKLGQLLLGEASRLPEIAYSAAEGGSSGPTGHSGPFGHHIGRR